MTTMMMDAAADEFDVYFRRAAEAAALTTASSSDCCQSSSTWRRESAPQTERHSEPSTGGSSCRRTSSSHHSRTASCKYPHRRATVPTVRHSNSVSPSKDKLLVPSPSAAAETGWQQNPVTSSSYATTKIRFQRADDDDDVNDSLTRFNGQLMRCLPFDSSAEK
jgi:hypothetical protein